MGVINDLQGVVRDIDGVVRVIKPRWYKGNPYLRLDQFPRSIQGTSFDAFVDEVRDVAGTSD